MDKDHLLRCFYLAGVLTKVSLSFIISYNFEFKYDLLEIAFLDMPLEQPLRETPQLKCRGSNTKSFI